MFCSKCGFELSDDTEFCSQCGMKVKTSLAENVKEPTKEVDPFKEIFEQIPSKFKESYRFRYEDEIPEEAIEVFIKKLKFDYGKERPLILFDFSKEVNLKKMILLTNVNVYVKDTFDCKKAKYGDIVELKYGKILEQLKIKSRSGAINPQLTHCTDCAPVIIDVIKKMRKHSGELKFVDNKQPIKKPVTIDGKSEAGKSVLKKPKKNWKDLSPKEKRNFILGGIGALIFLIIIVNVAKDNDTNIKDTPVPFTINGSIPNGKVTTKNEVIFSGEVNDENSVLQINGELADVKNSKYNKIYKLKMGLNKFNFVFKAGNKEEESKHYSIKRVTEKQLALERKKRAAEEEKARKVAERSKKIESQFSPWDGSHRRLERLIKQNMNDPDSYEHVKTVYWDRGNHLVVATTFRGKNAFGGKILNTVKAKISLDGDVLKIIQQY